MSVRKIRVVLAAKAERDVQGIQAYTVERWGQEQAAAYSEAMLRALEALQENPYLGRNRADLIADLRSHRVERHTIFYRVVGDELLVHRILHQRVEVRPDQLI